MPTAAERQALMFLISVALLGGGVRAYESHRRSAAQVETNGADDAGDGVDTQLASVDSARNTPRGGSRKKRMSSRRNSLGDSLATSDSRLNSSTEDSRQRQSGYRPRSRADGSAGSSSVPRRNKTAVAIDVDVASAQELEQLPRVGASLAQRIVANRDSLGAFGSAQALTRVRGIGPSLAKQLAPLVTFSSGPSPFHAEPRQRRH